MPNLAGLSLANIFQFPKQVHSQFQAPSVSILQQVIPTGFQSQDILSEVEIVNGIQCLPSVEVGELVNPLFGGDIKSISQIHFGIDPLDNSRREQFAKLSAQEFRGIVNQGLSRSDVLDKSIGFSNSHAPPKFDWLPNQARALSKQSFLYPANTPDDPKGDSTETNGGGVDSKGEGEETNGKGEEPSGEGNSEENGGDIEEDRIVIVIDNPHYYKEEREKAEKSINIRADGIGDPSMKGLPSTLPKAEAIPSQFRKSTSSPRIILNSEVPPPSLFDFNNLLGMVTFEIGGVVGFSPLLIVPAPMLSGGASITVAENGQVYFSLRLSPMAGIGLALSGGLSSGGGLSKETPNLGCSWAGRVEGTVAGFVVGGGASAEVNGSGFSGSIGSKHGVGVAAMLGIGASLTCTWEVRDGRK